ncbi:hypothetical protein J1C82_10800 [Streptococcus sanguinis]|uniref:LXG domain-containing protein n=1 Tax=Streptococcus sanguinis SK405 TaxID=888817 RepID=A0ABC9PAJ6_STRSA|nr:hypothetical protein [Streptococcus sanguinis]EGC23770.1 hypothetical protein HMPREF9390_2201 [Streptococcus sanguinis SK405]
MSEVIEVKDVPGLGTYSVSISSYAEAVQSAGDQTQRNFTDKIQGSHADAIQAFLSRLNTLQSQVFDQVPETLKKYSTIVSTFEGTVKGAGFTSRAKTSGDGINSVASKIETDQIAELETTKTSLKSALDKAAEVLGVESPDVVTPTKTATTELTQSVTNRKTAHQQLDQGNTVFKSELENIKATLEAYITVVQNAKAFASVNATYLFDQIKQGHLTAENMYYTGLIQNDADVEVLKIVLEDRPQDIGQIREKEVSSGGYRILGDTVMKWIEAGDFEEQRDINGDIMTKGRINILFEALGKVPEERTQHILKGMLFAGDEHAMDVIAWQEIEYASNGQQIGTDRMVAYDNELALVNRYNGLIKTLIYLDYGQVMQNATIDGKQKVPFNDVVRIKLSQLNGEIIVEHSDAINMAKGPKGPLTFNPEKWTTIYTSRIDTDYSSFIGSQAKERMTQLEEERTEAKITYVKSMAASLLTLVASAASFGTLATPTLMGFASVASKVILDRPTQAGVGALDDSGFQLFKTGRHQDPALAKLNHKRGVTAITAILDMMSAHQKYEAKDKGLGLEEREALAKLRKSYIGGGGWVLDAGANKEDTVMTNSDNYYDFRIYKRMQEMDTRGVLGYLEKNNIPKEKYTQLITDKHSGISPEMQDYLLGKEPNPEIGKVSINQMNKKQLQELEKGLKLLSNADSNDVNDSVDGQSSYKAYLSAIYPDPVK